jgi:hypothetical protein
MRPTLAAIPGAEKTEIRPGCGDHEQALAPFNSESSAQQTPGEASIPDCTRLPAGHPFAMNRRLA